jgi:hypothetical protein
MGIILEMDDTRFPKIKPPPLYPPAPGAFGKHRIQVTEKSSFRVFGRLCRFNERKVSTLEKLINVTEEQSVLSGEMVRKEEYLRLADDEPEIIYRVLPHALAACGNILCVGIGLGIFQRLALCNNSKVRHITTFEPDTELSRGVQNAMLFGMPHVATQPDFTSTKKYDYVFLGAPPGGIQGFSQAVAMAMVFKPLLVKGGKISILNYREMLLSFQERCQKLIPVAKDDDADLGTYPAIERHFIEWARKNKKRVLDRRDYKFVNAYARNLVEED